mmetsp:Transcript_30890/g.47118  ORF Transcript_30890/g.47118 Transcript_30890/m.47118 type:complete len:81 (-) Transcript_30890:112-354(-)
MAAMVGSKSCSKSEHFDTVVVDDDDTSLLLRSEERTFKQVCDDDDADIAVVLGTHAEHVMKSLRIRNPLTATMMISTFIL